MARVLEVLNFEGLGPNDTHVPDGYGGLSWKGANVYHPTSPGFASHGLHSGDSVIYNENAQPMNIFSRSDFALKNGLFSAAQENDVTVTFTGYAGGKVVVTKTVELDQKLTKIHFTDPAWDHINRLIISTDNAINPSYSQVTVEDLKLKVDAAGSAGASVTQAQDHHGHHHVDLMTDATHAPAYDPGALVV